MSEEKPRLSRREMREQGLLKVGREDAPVLRDDLQTRTSELQLRRPSRREMRLQREANEAKVAEQTSKLSASPSATEENTPVERRENSGRVHAFDFSKVGDKAPVQETPAQDVPEQAASAPEKQGETTVEKTAEPASSGRSSVFDRFASKDDDAVSFRDRLVARTREGQREARENQPDEASVQADDVAEEKTDGLGHFFGTESNESEAVEHSHTDEAVVEDAVTATEDKAEEALPDTDADVTEDSADESVQAQEATEEGESQPATDESTDSVEVEVASTPEDTGDEAENDTEGDDAQEETSADDTEQKTSEDDTVDSDDSTSSDEGGESSDDSNAVAAVAEDGRYPTDVSLRLTDDDEEKTGGDRLMSILIILIGVLIGVAAGLVVQNLIFGTEGVYPNFGDSVQAAACIYGVGS